MVEQSRSDLLSAHLRKHNKTADMYFSALLPGCYGSDDPPALLRTPAGRFVRKERVNQFFRNFLLATEDFRLQSNDQWIFFDGSFSVYQIVPIILLIDSHNLSLHCQTQVYFKDPEQMVRFFCNPSVPVSSSFFFVFSFCSAQYAVCSAQKSYPAAQQEPAVSFRSDPKCSARLF
jgi:hypothetical protein